MATNRTDRRRGIYHRAVEGADLGKMFAMFEDLLLATMKLLKSVGNFFPYPPTEAEVGWAVALAQSRAHFTDSGDGKEGDPVIWPWFAMGNHHWNHEMKLIPVNEQGRVRQLAQRPISKGEEVFVHYGFHSNLRLLVQYGFTIPDNPLLNTMPTSLLTSLAEALLRFHVEEGERFAAALGGKGAPCGDIDADTVKVLRRYATTAAAMPELLIACYRKSAFDDEATARRAAGVGYLDEGPTKDRVLKKAPAEWLERDARAHEELAEACRQARRELVQEEILKELQAFDDPWSEQLFTTLELERAAWEQCAEEMMSRAARCREAASRRTKKP